MRREPEMARHGIAGHGIAGHDVAASSVAPLQKPLGSGFGARSTAADVLAGIDLTGRTALVTGGYSGLGLEITRALVGVGAHVLVPARRPDVALEALAHEVSAGAVEVGAMDLADQASVASYADALLGGTSPAGPPTLDLVIANAAIMACPETRVGPGWEAQFATNHLGHFALINRLWPLVAPTARVVSVSSRAHQIRGMRWEDVHFTSGYERWQAYGQAKTANVLFAVGLDRRAAGSGVRAYSCHPGLIMTALQRHFSREETVEMGWTDQDGRGIDPSFKTPAQGAATAVWAATSPLLADAGPVYCVDADVAPADLVSPHATDPQEAERLWDYSVELAGVDAFAGT